MAYLFSDDDHQKRKVPRPRSVWVRDWLRSRQEKGACSLLLQELKLSDSVDDFRRYLRMDCDTYGFILEAIRQRITLKTTRFREPISPEVQLSVVLRYMATGESFSSLSFQFRVAENTISQILRRVCRAIIDEFMEQFMPFPEKEEAWQKISDLYQERWNFPNCVGAIDGKHIAIFKPHKGGSDFYNYKGFNSIVLMAVVDADYKFIFIDVGCQGKLPDGAVFRNCEFRKLLDSKSLNLPPPRPLPDLNMGNAHDDSFLEGCRNETPLPCVFVADDAFPLDENMMKPFSQTNLTDGKRIFNYRLSRARRTSENAFGILANIFRVFHTKIYLSTESAQLLVVASCVLHNLLRLRSPTTYMPQASVDHVGPNGDIVPGEWRQDQESPYVTNLPATAARNSKLSVENIRNVFKDYFMKRGSVYWQWKHIYHD